ADVHVACRSAGTAHEAHGDRRARPGQQQPRHPVPAMVTPARANLGSKKRVRTGIAISPTALCAADIRLRGSGDHSWRASLDAQPPENGHWPSLTSALAELARTLGVTHGTLAISLMPPFTEVRRLELPPLKDDEIQRVLSRQASRYFVAAKTPQVVGASTTGKRARNTPASV